MSACRLLESVGVKLLWGDSLGAKSMAFFVEPGILVDPGAAAMHPSYPLGDDMKRELRRKALEAVKAVSPRARVIVVTHYHYDHYARPWDDQVKGLERIYLDGKIIVAKNPNVFINESQWRRAREFFEELARLSGLSFDELYCEPKSFEEPPRPENNRRREWLNKLLRLWSSNRWICNGASFSGSRLVLGDEASVEYNGVRVRLLGSFFHGDFYERTGWVTPVLIEARGQRILYTSDLMGPVVEEYVWRLGKYRPEIVIADGPPTYMYPYKFSKRSLERALANIVRFIEEYRPILLIYDHHLLRERKWRERAKPLYEAANRVGIGVYTVAECLGQQPLIDKL